MNLRDELNAIYQRRGELTPPVVVEEARDRTHPLHAKFEWDDAVGGEAYRRIQARELIRSVRVTFGMTEDGRRKSIRAFHVIPSQPGYVPVEQITGNPMATELLLAEMRRDWLALKRRFDTFQEFWEMVRDAIESAA